MGLELMEIVMTASAMNKNSLIQTSVSGNKIINTSKQIMVSQRQDHDQHSIYFKGILTDFK